MATNPLFQSYNCRTQETFNTKTVSNLSVTLYPSAMAQRPPRDPPGGKRPLAGEENLQAKRRRLEDPKPDDDDDDWDDSFEFTQQDLETLDIMASQAIGENPVPGPSTSAGAEQTSLRERTAGDASFATPAPGSSVPSISRLKLQSSTSGSDTSSVYPQSSASFRRTSSSDVSTAPGSLSKSSSSNTSTDHANQSIRDVTVLSAPNGAGDSVAVLTGLREELRKKNEEVQRARSEVFARDGEVKYLKDSLHKQEQELEKLRAEREEKKEAEEEKQKEREKELKKEVERLQTQIQFKEQDVEQLRQRCRNMEGRLSHQTSTSPAKPSTSAMVTMSQPTGSPDKSPRVVKVAKGQGHHTPEKGTFPSHQSFMSTEEVSTPPRVQAHPSASRGTMTTEEFPGKSQSQQSGRESERQKRCRLNLTVQLFEGKTTGPRLASQLFRCQCGSSGEVEDSGILGLLQMLPSRIDLAELHYERDKTTERLSPVKKRRQSSQEMASPPASSQQPPKHIVSQEHFLLAAHGLRQLTDATFPQSKLSTTASTSTSKDSSTVAQSKSSSQQAKLLSDPRPSTSFAEQGSAPAQQPGPSTSVQQSSTAQQGSTAAQHSSTITQQGSASTQGSKTVEQIAKTPSGAVLLLPMLNDYLAHYIDILSSGSSGGGGVQKVGSPTVSSVTSSSAEGSSLESLTSSLGVLLRQGAEYANSLETLTLSALRVLHMLVCACQDVRSVVVRSWGSSLIQPGTATDTSSSTIETDRERDKTNESGLEGDDERSATSSTNSSLAFSPADAMMGSPASTFQGLNLLIKLVRLASPSHESTGFNASVLEASLDVLIALAVHLHEPDLDRLSVVVLRGVLTDCLQLQLFPAIVHRTLMLFSSLVRSRCILQFLCNKSDTCTLLNVHLVCTRLVGQFRGKQEPPQHILPIFAKVIDGLTALLSSHQNGVYVLTADNCRCSGQIIPSLVHAMFFLLRDYQLSLSADVFHVLRNGVLLLHSISLKDPHYQQRHSQVAMHYNPLISALARIYRDQDGLSRAEEMAMEDLAEEVEDSDSGSQDNDREETMATD